MPSLGPAIVIAVLIIVALALIVLVLAIMSALLDDSPKLRLDVVPVDQTQVSQ